MEPAYNVEIFRTDVQHFDYTSLVTAKINVHFPEYQVNFDLEDCDRILRVKAHSAIDARSIMEILNHLGFNCDLFVEHIGFVPTANLIERNEIKG